MDTISVALLLITPFNATIPGASDCLSASFYGTYGFHDVFRPDLSCLQSVDPPPYSPPAIAYVPKDDYEFVWVEQQAVDGSLNTAGKNDLEDLFARLSPNSDAQDASQGVLPLAQNAYEIMYRTPSSLL